MITCHYCRASNTEDEHRCRRCGRRLSGSFSDTASEMSALSVQGALAAAPAPAPAFRHETVERAALPAAAPRTSAPQTPTQRPLFSPREAGKVIPFESLPGAAPAPAKPAPRAPSRRQASPRPANTQQSLDFLPPAPQAARKLGTTVDAVIYCDAPVAAAMHRAVAAAIDASLVLIAFGVFLLAAHLGGVRFAADQTTLLIFGAALGAIAVFYHLIWILGFSESPGRRWMELRLTNFDGFPPDPMQRAVRFAGACLSLASLGAGVLWAMVDEESLTWHDHMSKTFLTVREPESNFVRQR